MLLVDEFDFSLSLSLISIPPVLGLASRPLENGASASRVEASFKRAVDSLVSLVAGIWASACR